MSKTANAILKVLSAHQDEIIGSRELSRQLTVHGIDLTERTIRYHMKIMDEQGLTKVYGKEGRKITKRGLEELARAGVSERVGFINSKIDNLAFRTAFDMNTKSGKLVINTSLFPESEVREAVKILKKVFASPYVMSEYVAMAGPGERIGESEIPEGKIGIGTICSVTINGIFLKAGIPVQSRFGGLLQVNEEDGPTRFVALISYEGSSLDPHLVFIKSRMTSVLDVINHNEGNVLASFREFPVVCLERALELQETLKAIGINGILSIGKPNQSHLEVPVTLDKVGMAVVGGLNPVAALEEAGIETSSAAMSSIIEYSDLLPVREAVKRFIS